MTFRDTFCSGPWLHMKITSTGDFEYCRWARQNATAPATIWDTGVAEYFQNNMRPIRERMLAGDTIPECADCHIMDQHGKASGRARQLLKTGVQLKYFDHTMAASPWRGEFDAGGVTAQLPVDWQINLGNFCNSACIFCVPTSSSRLAAEFQKIGWLRDLPKKNWVDDPDALDRFIEVLCATKNLRYMHFLGGETLITPGFKRILERVIAAGLTDVSIGFTTNLTVWDDDIVALLCKFREVNLGVSIETLDEVNDYVRWPSRIGSVRQTLDRWCALARERGWITTMRITPTLLTVDRLVPVFEYAVQNGLNVESCNFISEPEFMNTTVLPHSLRITAVHSLLEWIADRTGSDSVNTRHRGNAEAQVVAEARAYVRYLAETPELTNHLPALCEYLSKLDSNRKNSVLDYRPDYEQLLRANGYTR